MTSAELEKICTEVRLLTEQVATFIHDELGKVTTEKVETKSLNSLVSYVDKEAENRLVAGLTPLIPEAGFLTEEEVTTDSEGDYQWIIDPLDGTTNFLHQIPFFSVTLALRHQNETILGIVYEVVRKECFYAWKGGGGAYLNGKKISVRKGIDLDNALLATGFPYYDFDRMDGYFDFLRQLMQRSRGLRRFGSAALDLAYVACGRFDGFFEYGLNAWDVAGGAFIVQEAGGMVTDFSGEDDFVFGRELLAAVPEVHREMLPLVKTSFA